jgi:hypothetical protein
MTRMTASARRACAAVIGTIFLLVTYRSQAGEDPFMMPHVKGAVRGLHVWKAGGLLLVPTVSDGTWFWRAQDDAPSPKPLDLGRVEKVEEWNGALYLVSESGLFWWNAGEERPRLLPGVPGHSFRFGHWGDRLLVYTDGLYAVAGDGTSLRIGKEQHFWTFTEWESRLWYGNLQGLFSLDTPNAQPKTYLTESGGVDWLVADDAALFIGTRSAGTFRFARGAERPERIGESFGFFRAQIRWHDRTLVATDNGIWDPARDPPAVLRVSDVWAGFQPWGDDLLIGSNAGLFLWRAGASGPELSLPMRIESLVDWNGNAVISTLENGIWMWPRGAPNPRRFPVQFGAVDSFALWRGGLAVGLDDRTFADAGGDDSREGSLAFLEDSTIAGGRVELKPIAKYDVGQPVYVSWRIAESRVAPIADFFRQHLTVRDEAGNAVGTVAISERNRTAPTEFEANLPPLAAGGSYRVVVEALPPLGAALTASAPLQIGGAGPFSLRQFMGWHRPSDVGDLMKTIALNGVLAGVFYLALVLVLFVVAPASLVSLHEAIVAGRLPGGDFAAKFAVPTLVVSDRCLDALVRDTSPRALRVFEGEADVKARPTWVPAPLKLNGELVREFRRPTDLAANSAYVPGLFELRRTLPAGSRTSISIEGPGGVGKSALAFQVARWAASEAHTVRLFPHRALPVLVQSPGKSVDEAVASRLAYVLDLPRISGRLLEALLRKRRVLAIVDSVSEKPEEVMHIAIRPDAGALNTHALVVTSRLATALADAVVVNPQGLTLGYLDAVLDELIGRTLGAGRFADGQRETIRSRLKSIMEELTTPEHPGAEIPMLVVVLMLRRANELAIDAGSDLATLPSTLSGLVQDYVGQLLSRDGDDSQMLTARRAAVACLGTELTPTWRPAAAYAAEGLTDEQLRDLVRSGLLVQGGAPDDLRYKFAFDPVAEYLGARESIIRIRDGTMQEATLRAWLDAAGERASSFREIIARTSLEVLQRTL